MSPRLLMKNDSQNKSQPNFTKEISKKDWLENNDKAYSSVLQGLQQSSSGQTKSLGSFAQYAELDIDD
jgi:hypothetical protein